MNLQEVYSEVSRRAQQETDRLDVIDAQVVLATFFDYLHDLDVCDAMKLVSKGLEASHKQKQTKD